MRTDDRASWKIPDRTSAPEAAKARERGKGMDGYTLTVGSPLDPLTPMPDGVRYVAELADGTGFVAWDERPPAIAGTVLIAEEPDDGWWWFKIRKLAATEADHFYLLSRDAFDLIADEQPAMIRAATRVTDGRVIVQTDTPLMLFGGWGGHAVRYVQRELTYEQVVRGAIRAFASA